MKLVFFSVSQNGENGLGDEGADEAMLPRIFGLEPPRGDKKEGGKGCGSLNFEPIAKSYVR